MEIELDKKRTLTFTLNAMVKFEEARGKPIFKQDGSAADIRALLWSGLLKDDPKLTLEQAGSLVDESNMAYVSDKIAEAWGRSLPKKDGGDPLPKSTG